MTTSSRTQPKFLVDTLKNVRVFAEGIAFRNAPKLPKTENAFKYYPNPVSELLVIEAEKPLEDASVLQVIDLLGRPVMQLNCQKQEQSWFLETSTLKSGLYMLQLIGETTPKQFLGRFTVIEPK